MFNMIYVNLYNLIQILMFLNLSYLLFIYYYNFITKLFIYFLFKDKILFSFLEFNKIYKVV